jgi:hypothetical protein
MFARALDRLLDAVWDATLPIASACPVCAFYRGALAGALVVFAIRLFR